MVNRFEKYGCADVSFGVRWSKLYVDDAVVTSVWDVPEGITKGAEAISNNVCSVQLSGGTVGESYTLKNTVVLASGQTDCEYITIKVVDEN